MIRLELRQFAGTGVSEFKSIGIEDLDHDAQRMTHTVTAGAGGDVDFSAIGAGCTLTATATEETDHIMIEGTLVGDVADEKARFLDFCLPLDQTSMMWCKNYDEETALDANGTDVYYESHHPTIRHGWQLCQFPISAATDATRGVCIGNSVEIPRHHKPFRNVNGLFLRHHVGLHANRNTFSFKFALYKFSEPAWHMRSAMAKYRSIFADQFTEYLTSPNHRHGTQIYTLNGVVADTYDFGVSYNFRGAVDPGFVANHNDGVAHTPHAMGTEFSVTTISAPELADATQAKDLMDGFETGMDGGINFTWPTTGGTYALDRHDPPGPFSVERTRFDNSKIQTLTGALILFDFTYPLQVLGTNASPQCTSPNAHDLEFDYLTVPQIALHTDESIDFRGHSHDNCAIGAGRAEENYNSGDFAAMTTDLSFNIDTKRVHMKTAYTYWETLKFYSDNMHARSPYAISVGNLPSGQPQATQIYSGVLDALGGESETNKNATEKGVWREQLRDKRALAGGRCMNGISRDVYAPGDADLPRLWSINFLYQCWVSMIGINYQGTAGDFSAADRTECENWYPILKILDAAGPDNHIPYATSNTADTFIERCGTFGGADLHFIAYNGTTGSLSPTFTLDKTSLGLPATTTWTDIWNDGGGGSQAGVDDMITVTIPSYRAVVFAVT